MRRFTLQAMLAMAGTIAVAAGQETPVPIPQEPRHKVVFEAGTTRVHDVQVPAGDTTLYHIHDTPILYVPIGRSRTRSQTLGADWTGGDASIPRGAAAAASNAPQRVTSTISYVERPVTHRVQNVGDSLFRLIAIVNRAGGSDGEEDNASKLAATPELVNRYYRAWRVTLAPGQTAAAHQHATPVVVVQQTPGRVGVTSTTTAELTQPGAFAYHDGSGSHATRNLGNAPVDVIEVELRGAQAAATTPSAPRPGVDWPAFRGIAASGVGDGPPVPASWNVPAKQGVRWRTPIPGLGHSSPVVWGNTICTATAINAAAEQQLKVGLYGNIESVEEKTEYRWVVMCLDKTTGAVRWERTAHHAIPQVKRHPKSTHASSTLATDGRHLVAFFGSEGLYAYDLNGQLLWKKDLGLLDSGFFMAPDAQWGFASSPIIHDGRVIVQADVQKGSFVAAFDVATGRELWRTARADVPTWSSPAVVTLEGRAQVVVNGWKHIGGYDLATGKELWRMTGGGDIPVPTPIVADGLVFITNAHGKLSPIYAVRPTAAGNITLKEGETSNAHIAWSYLRDGGYMQTPLVYQGLLYVCRDNGVLSVFDAKTGQRHHQSRLGDGATGFTASAVASGGRVYFTSEDGDVYVLKAGPVFELLATNALGEVAMATPAISEGRLYFRTRGHIVAVGE